MVKAVFQDPLQTLKAATKAFEFQQHHIKFSLTSGQKILSRSERKVAEAEDKAKEMGRRLDEAEREKEKLSAELEETRRRLAAAKANRKRFGEASEAAESRHQGYPGDWPRHQQPPAPAFRLDETSIGISGTKPRSNWMPPVFPF